MSTGKILAANWKMAVSRDLFISIAASIIPVLNSYEGKNQLWIAPSDPYLAEVKQIFSSSKVKVGAQNACWDVSGAFTGETSVKMLNEVGSEFVIIGHSERRSIFSETDHLCAKRAKGIMEQNMPIVYCLGETHAEREANKTETVLSKQIAALVSAVAEVANKSELLTFAYEPVWAIGTGLTAQSEQIIAAHSWIEKEYSEMTETDTKVKILYGGSVNPSNWSELLSLENVAGGLVGGASQKPESMLALCETLFAR